MLYQTLTGNAATLGTAKAAGGTVSATPAEMPQTVQNAMLTGFAVTATIDANGAFTLSLLQGAKVRIVAKDSNHATFYDGTIHLTDHSALDISAYLAPTPPASLGTIYIAAAISAAEAKAAAEAASVLSAGVIEAVTTTAASIEASITAGTGLAAEIDASVAAAGAVLVDATTIIEAANGVAESANLASNYAATAAGHATNASNHADAAALSDTDAALHATAAGLSETAAAGSAATATTKAAAADLSATNAATSASSATSRANEAAASAVSASGSATTATTRANSAAASVTAAAAHVTTAAGHVTTATTQAGLATTAAGNAAASELAAANSETAASGSASAAAGLALAASGSADAAAASALAADGSADAAAASAASLAIATTLVAGKVKPDGTTIGVDVNGVITSIVTLSDLGGIAATSGSAIQKANGSGGLTPASAGTDYQAPLASGTNIKTINSASILGSGDVVLPTLGANTFTDDQILSDNELKRAMLTDCGYTGAAKGNSGTATQTYDYTAGSVQSSTATGNHTIATSNWPPTGNMGEILIFATNFGAYTITWPTINWVKSDGTTTTTFASSGVTLQASGIDFILLWSMDGGTTIYGKVMR